jgi:drug/metabolite transporter (DMT)-like permease
MRSLTALALAVTLAGTACQTQRQAVTAGVICTIIGAGAGYATYSARNDDEGPPAFLPLSFLAFGSIGVISFIQAIALEGDDKPATKQPTPAPTTTPPTPK